MKCPKCGSTVRPSKKYPGYYLCDTCRKRYPGSSIIHTTSAKSSQDSSVPKKKNYKKKRMFGKFLLLLLLFASVFSVFYLTGLFPRKNAATPKPEKTDTFLSTDTASLNGINLQIQSVQTSAGNELIKPSVGNVFLHIELQVENTTNSSKQVNGISDFTLFSNGKAFSHSAASYEALSEKLSRLHTELGPNTAATGYLCYEVPADWDNLKLQYINPKWSLHKVQIELFNEQQSSRREN